MVETATAARIMAARRRQLLTTRRSTRIVDPPVAIQALFDSEKKSPAAPVTRVATMSAVAHRGIDRARRDATAATRSGSVMAITAAYSPTFPNDARANSRRCAWIACIEVIVGSIWTILNTVPSPIEMPRAATTTTMSRLDGRRYTRMAAIAIGSMMPCSRTVALSWTSWEARVEMIAIPIRPATATSTSRKAAKPLVRAATLRSLADHRNAPWSGRLVMAPTARATTKTDCRITWTEPTCHDT